MKTTIEELQEYIMNNYNLKFEYDGYGKNKYLKYKDKKKEYLLSCGYARQPKIDDSTKEYWSIFHDFMDYTEWYGYGSAELDNGNETIDIIMEQWGFIKKEKQLTIFDL